MMMSLSFLIDTCENPAAAFAAAASDDHDKDDDRDDDCNLDAEGADDHAASDDERRCACEIVRVW